MQYESTDRTIKLDNDTSWFWIGLRIGLGFSLASAIVASITAVIWATWIENGVELKMRDLNKAMPRVVQPGYSYTPTSPAAASLPTIEHGTRHVAGRPSTECLAESNGVYDERYERCTHGFMESY